MWLEFKKALRRKKISLIGMGLVGIGIIIYIILSMEVV